MLLELSQVSPRKPAQSPPLLHCTHEVMSLHTGELPEQVVLSMHCTHLPAPVLHRFAFASPAQWVSLRHCTQPLANLQ